MPYFRAEFVSELYNPHKMYVKNMVYILDGSPEVGPQRKKQSLLFVCLWHLIRTRAVKNRIFLPTRTNFPSCVRNMF